MPRPVSLDQAIAECVRDLGMAPDIVARAFRTTVADVSAAVERVASRETRKRAKTKGAR